MEVSGDGRIWGIRDLGVLNRDTVSVSEDQMTLEMDCKDGYTTV